MQTFLPFPDLRVSCQVLDDRRLGKQRVETFQVLRALTWPDYAWKNHPAVRMWRGFVPALVEYGLESCREWTRRGHADSVGAQLLGWTGGTPPRQAPLPPWFGLEALHRSHRSALLRKDPAWYRPLFDAAGHAGEPDDLPYVWPAAVFPRWPVRAGLDGVGLDEAARLLGLERPHPWQADAARAAASGRDVVLVARPASGGSTAGLLAGLVRPGRTLWVTPWDGPVAGPAPRLPPPVPRGEAAGRSAVADRPPPLARPPGPVELAAMAAEQAPPEFLFAHPDRLPRLEPSSGGAADVGLVVVDGADRLTPAEAASVAGWRAGAGAPPVLAVTGAADAARRAAVAGRLGLRGPVHAGGGWDVPETRLEVRAGRTAAARAALLAALVRRGDRALVVTATRARAERLVGVLAADGLRATVWAPPPMRASRAAAAVAGWRTRRLDALVLPAGPLPPLGRVRAGLLVAEDAAVEGPEQWHGLVEAVRPVTAVLLTGAGTAPSPSRLTTPGCRRAALLLPFGEPVGVPCGRCDACAPADAAATAG